MSTKSTEQSAESAELAGSTEVIQTVQPLVKGNGSGKSDPRSHAAAALGLWLLLGLL